MDIVTNIKGNFKLVQIKNGIETILVDEHNLVVNKASEILRDLMYGDANKIISEIQFGDMNLTEDDDLKNVPEPSLTDEALVHKLYSKDVEKKKTTYEESPAIEYSVTLGEDEFNGDGSQLITEYGLVNQSGELFAKKNRAAIYKDSESSLKFLWTIVFN